VNGHDACVAAISFERLLGVSNYLRFFLVSSALLARTAEACFFGQAQLADRIASRA
jgi:hypothetical protein